MNKKNVIIAIVIIGIVSLFIPLTSAIFKSSGNSEKAISAASWEVSLNQTGLSDSVTLIAGVDTQTYTLKVRSNSEVDATYAVEIGNVPTGVKIKLGENGEYKSPDANGKILFPNAGTILYSSQQKENTHTLYFTSEAGTTPVSNRTFTVHVIIQQVL